MVSTSFVRMQIIIRRFTCLANAKRWMHILLFWTIEIVRNSLPPFSNNHQWTIFPVCHSQVKDYAKEQLLQIYKSAKGSLFCFSGKNWEAVKLRKCVNEPLCCSNSPVPSLKGPQLLCKLPTSIVPLSAGLYLTLLLLDVNTAQKSPTALLVPKKSPGHLALGIMHAVNRAVVWTHLACLTLQPKVCVMYPPNLQPTHIVNCLFLV